MTLSDASPMLSPHFTRSAADASDWRYYGFPRPRDPTPGDRYRNARHGRRRPSAGCSGRHPDDHRRGQRHRRRRGHRGCPQCRRALHVGIGRRRLHAHLPRAPQGACHVGCAGGLTPQAAEVALFDEQKKSRGPMSPLVPAACAGWLEALRRYGTMDAATAFAPAIELAEHGFALTVTGHTFFDGCRPGLLA